MPFNNVVLFLPLDQLPVSDPSCVFLGVGAFPCLAAQPQPGVPTLWLVLGIEHVDRSKEVYPLGDKVTGCYGAKTHVSLSALRTVMWPHFGLPTFERPMLTLLEWGYPESERNDDSALDFWSYPSSLRLAKQTPWFLRPDEELGNANSLGLLPCSFSAKMKCLSAREDSHPLIKKAEILFVPGISTAPGGYLCDGSGAVASRVGLGWEAFQVLRFLGHSLVGIIKRLLSPAETFLLWTTFSMNAKQFQQL